MEQNQTNNIMSHPSPLHSSLDNELPFLISHYLSNYRKNGEVDGNMPNDNNTSKKELLARIQSLGNELSDAFHKLGSFGTIITQRTDESLKSANDNTVDVSGIVTENANYADLVHRHARLPPDHLKMLIHSSVAASRASQESFFKEIENRPPLSLLDSSASRSLSSSESLPVWTALQPPVLLLAPSGDEAVKKPASTSGGRISDETRTPPNEPTSSSRKMSSKGIPVEVGYDRQIALFAANQSRIHIGYKMQLQNNRIQIKSTLVSLNYQRQQKQSLEILKIADLEKDIIRLECDRVIPQLGRKLSELEDQKNKLLMECANAFIKTSKARKEAATISMFHDPTVVGIAHSRYLPVPAPVNSSPYLLTAEENWGKPRPSLFRTIISRPYVGRAGMLRKPNQFGSRPSSAHCLTRQVLARQMSHSVTINGHLFYPVYCLRFDKTGQYFVSGADDSIVKLFYIGGASPSTRNNGRPTFKYGGNATRGAILVCTLRGHTGVIADIDVSSDNALLATASEDGDCRIWGLKDGCPVAILRGHVGGVNMVSWSLLTPFRLVTVAQDGLARIWDVRGAAVKRYARMIGKRSDYLPNIEDDEPNITTDDQNISTTQNDPSSSTEAPSPLNNQDPENHDRNNIFVPLLPPILADINNEIAIASNAVQNQGAVVVHPPPGADNEISLIPNAIQNQAVVDVPPLPPGADNNLSLVRNVVQNQDVNRNGDINFGTFAANDECDEGVYLLAKLQHGDVTLEDSAQPPEAGLATRSRRKTVHVICLARCPLGGHFATGSDDGLGRVWADIDDERVESLDDGQATISKRTRPNSKDVTPSKDLTLAVLSGHLNAITDIQYSHAGDRILTASQKDGNVRIWSWGKEILPEDENAFNSMKSKGKEEPCKIALQNMSQILIILSGPSSKSNGSQRKKGRGGDNGSGKIICDVAVWSFDDSYVITSQSTLHKSSTSGIILPGSNIICVWNSRNGHCLMALSGAHESSCPVLAPHPFLTSILASAGADGKVQIWDLDSGKSFFSHRNVLTYGALENDQKGKNGGYLDGSFSPDGLSLALTDDNGRITMIDSLRSQDALKKSNSSQGVIVVDASSIPTSSDDQNHEDINSYPNSPQWMQEQYFANDYYELVYDAHGYAIERGSGMSPHMAPRAARCNHSGAPVSDDVNITYRFLCGPLPTEESDCHVKRQQIRQSAHELRKLHGGSIKMLQGKGKKVSAQNRIQSACATVFVVDRNIAPTQKSRTNEQIRPSTGQVRQLSTNYRWTNAHEEAVDASDNSEDESYEQPQLLEQNDSDVLSVSSVEVNQPGQRTSPSSTGPVRTSSGQPRSRTDPSASRNERRAPIEQPTRMSQRQSTRQNNKDEYVEDSSDDLSFVQEGSLNTTPRRDKNDFSKLDHFFKLPDGASKLVQRDWVTRLQSSDGYSGKKMYCPQVGDSVVYIPRAHSDLIQQFPTRNDSLHPWQHFPSDANWPVVRCNITKMRYRFPYSSYFRSTSGTKCSSIVLILSLEVTGYQTGRNSPFPWPAPEFIPHRQTRSTTKIEFEVSVFDVGEADVADFIIPENLYIWRVKSLEAAIGEQNSKGKDVALFAYYRQDNDKGQDLEFEQHRGILATTDRITDSNGQSHLLGSGYNSVVLSWENQTSEDPFCTWEIDVVENIIEKPLPPSLTDNDKSAFLHIIDRLTDDQEIKDWLVTEPDYSRYYDYDLYIEVPMYFSKIRRRLNSSYYSNKLSVAADIRLIEVNCYKYNLEDSDIAIAATRMLTLFETFFNGSEFKFPTIGPNTRGMLNTKIDGECHESFDINSNMCYAGLPGDDVSDVSNTNDHGTGGRLASSAPSVAVHHLSHNGSILETLPSLQNTVAHRDPVLEGSNDESNATNRSQRRSVQQLEDQNDDVFQEIDSESNSSNDCPPSDSRSSYSKDRSNDSKYHSKEEFDYTKSDNMSDDYSSDENSNQVKTKKGACRNQTTSLRSSRNITSITAVSPRNKKSEKRDSDYSEDVSLDSEDMSIAKRSNKAIQPKQIPPRKRGRPKVNVSRRGPFTARGRGRPKTKSWESENESENEYQCLSDNSDTLNMSDFDSDEYCPSKVKRKSKGGSKRKRKRKPAATSTNKKGKKRVKPLPDESDPDTDFYPLLPSWPRIDSKHTYTLATYIIQEVVRLDDRECFMDPVTEQYPGIAEEYFGCIESPMEIRTINQRLESYKMISELQEDLILMFKNCCKYNGEKTDLWYYSVKIWKQLNDIFKQACNKENIDVPRRF